MYLGMCFVGFSYTFSAEHSIVVRIFRFFEESWFQTLWFSFVFLGSILVSKVREAGSFHFSNFRFKNTSWCCVMTKNNKLNDQQVNKY